MENDRLFYIAGIMDSGCRIAIENQQGVYRPIIEITRKDRSMLIAVQYVFGGSVRPFRNSYQLRVRGGKAYVMAREMQPLVMCYGKQLELLLNLSVLKDIRGINDQKEALRKQLMA